MNDTKVKASSVAESTVHGSVDAGDASAELNNSSIARNVKIKAGIKAGWSWGHTGDDSLSFSDLF